MLQVPVRKPMVKASRAKEVAQALNWVLDDAFTNDASE
jgi:hypothetical protein